MTNKSEIDALRAELEKVKRQLPPTMPTEKEIAAHRDQVHQLAEARMSRAAYFSPEDLRAMRAAAPDDVCRSIVRDNRGGITPRSVIPSSPTSSNVLGGGAGPPGGGIGWMRETPIAPPPGIRYVDAQMDAQDERDKAERERAEAMRKLRR
jgi:hypothetical protein